MLKKQSGIQFNFSLEVNFRNKKTEAAPSVFAIISKKSGVLKFVNTDCNPSIMMP